MNEKEENLWLKGYEACASSVIGTLLVRIKPEDRTLASLSLERRDAILSLRNLCEKHGDNDWPDNLHLSDIIDKHLANHLGKKQS